MIFESYILDKLSHSEFRKQSNSTAESMISFNDNELSDLELEMTDTENDIYEGKHISPLELSLHSNGSRTRSSSEYSEHNSSNINNT